MHIFQLIFNNGLWQRGLWPQILLQAVKLLQSFVHEVVEHLVSEQQSPCLYYHVALHLEDGTEFRVVYDEVLCISAKDDWPKIIYERGILVT